LEAGAYEFYSPLARCALILPPCLPTECLIMSLRDAVLIQRDAIRSADLELLIDPVRQAQMTDSPVSNFEDAPETDSVEWVIDRKIRNTQQVHLPAEIAERLSSIEDGNVLAFINPFFDVEVRDREPSQILHYGVGGHYIPHVDAETLYKDDTGLDLWEKTLDRDLSVVYFLNDDFSGGELYFPVLDLTIQPEAGTLVCFPSDHNYIHGVRPVISGHRYTAVTWMRVKGTPSVDEINQMAMDEYHRMWPKQSEQHSRLGKGGAVKR
jgi:predicted 2-oxoglutarate/Fe(II)-dependent dioxygenase YbiX